MKCSEFLHELTSYLDGVLDEKTKVELENHLSWCHNCYVVCDTTKKTIEIYRDSQLYELPDDLRSRLRSAIMTKCQQQKSAAPKAYKLSRCVWFYDSQSMYGQPRSAVQLSVARRFSRRAKHASAHSYPCSFAIRSAK